MTISAEHHPHTHRIIFEIEISSDTALEKLAYSYLVEMKFGAELGDMSRSRNIGRAKFAQIELKFPDYDQYNEAKLHCQQHITREGEILPSYVGALDYADRDYMESKDRLEKLKKMKAPK